MRVGEEGKRSKTWNHTLFSVSFFLSPSQSVREQFDGVPLHPSKENSHEQFIMWCGITGKEHKMVKRERDRNYEM